MAYGVSKVKITVLKRTIQQDLIEEHMPDDAEMVQCELFDDDQEFIVEDWHDVPEGFCDWAWSDIRHEIYAVANGAEFLWNTKSGGAITCCTDGLRPVIFKVERVD